MTPRARETVGRADEPSPSNVQKTSATMQCPNTDEKTEGKRARNARNAYDDRFSKGGAARMKNRDPLGGPRGVKKLEKRR